MSSTLAYNSSLPKENVLEIRLHLQANHLVLGIAPVDMLDAVDANMFEVIDDLFLAGTETTGTTLYWGLLYLILHPEIQAKCRLEMSQVRTNMDKIERRCYCVYTSLHYYFY